MPVLGDIYFPIALSIVAGYIIYSFTTEYPRVMSLKGFMLRYYKLLLNMQAIRVWICENFQISDEIYKKGLTRTASIESVLNEMIAGGKKNDDLISLLWSKIGEIESSLNDVVALSYMLPKSFTKFFIRYHVSDIFLHRKPKDYLFVNSTTHDLAIQIDISLRFLDKFQKEGVLDLKRLGCSKGFLQFFK